MKRFPSISPNIAAQSVVGVSRESPLAQMVEKVFLRIPNPLGDFAPSVGKNAEFAFGGNFGVKLAQ